MTLRIGILGAARVATYAMIEPARTVGDVAVVAVAARDPARAAAYAATHAIPNVLPDYAALIADPGVDAVYNALPPHLHARWSIAAVDAGKPVLCEKPFALTLDDAAAMVAAERRTSCLIMEAQHSHYHPLSARMRAMVAGGALGTILSAEAVFDVPVAAVPGEIRHDRAVGGGALWDLGVYPAYWLRSALGTEPRVVAATQRHGPQGADLATQAELETAHGARLTLSCAMDAPMRASIRFTGTHGTLSIINPLQPQSGHRFDWEIDGQAGSARFDDAPPTYQAQLAAFRDAVLAGASVPTRGDDSLSTLRLLAAIDALARKE